MVTHEIAFKQMFVLMSPTCYERIIRTIQTRYSYMRAHIPVSVTVCKHQSCSWSEEQTVQKQKYHDILSHTYGNLAFPKNTMYIDYESLFMGHIFIQSMYLQDSLFYSTFYDHFYTGAGFQELFHVLFQGLHQSGNISQS